MLHTDRLENNYQVNICILWVRIAVLLNVESIMDLIIIILNKFQREMCGVSLQPAVAIMLHKRSH